MLFYHIHDIIQLMFEELSDGTTKSEKGLVDRRSLLNFFLFLLLTVISPIFTIGRFTKTPLEGYGYPTEQFGEWIYYPGLPTQTRYLLPISIIFIALLVLLFYRMRKEIKPNKLILSLYIVFVAIRLISYLGGPVGNQTFVFQDREDTKYIVNIAGTSRLLRFTSVANQFFFYTYICAFFHFIKPLTKENIFCFQCLSIARHILVFSRIAYARIKQRTEIIGNLERLLHKKDSFRRNITSYTTNRNVFGFFLFIGYAFAIADFRRRENVFSLLLAVLYIAFAILIISKTPALLRLTLSLCFTICYPIFNFHSKRGWSIFFLCLLIFTFLLVVFACLLTPSLIQYIYRRFTARTTRYSRYSITATARTRLKQSPFYLTFGFGRYPFIAIFTQYSSKIYGYPYPTSHDSYGDILLEFGILGRILLVAAYLLVAYYLLKRLFKDKKQSTIIYILGAIGLSIYSFSEPRALFLREGTSLFFLFLACMPFLEDAYLDRQSITILKSRLIHKLQIRD